MIINFRKRKNPLIIAAILLAMIGFGWWRVTAPPAFADFVYKAGGKVEFLGVSRHQYVFAPTVPGDFCQTWAFKTTAPVRSVVLALGDQIGDENVFLNTFAATGAMNEMNFGIIARKEEGSQEVLVQITKPLSPSPVDNSISKVWPGWLDLRFGNGESLALGDELVLADLWSAIKKLRPKMKVSPF